MNGHALDGLSCLIPLYRSERFLSTLYRNIDEHLVSGATVHISDMHCEDDAIDILKSRYVDSKNVNFYASNGGESWVDNINFLITKVNTSFFRIMPHDDIISSESSEQLIVPLLNDTDAILAYGSQLGIDYDGNRSFKFDNRQDNENCNYFRWDISTALSVYWERRFNGAFKGVIRTSKIIDNSLLIDKTDNLVHSERAWLYALALLGRFILVRESLYLKRIYPGSTHSQWTYDEGVINSVTSLLIGYSDKLILNQKSFNLARQYIFIQSELAVEWVNDGNSYHTFVASN